MNRQLSWQERFWSRVKKTESCWIWVGSKTTSGYGNLYVNGKHVATHRLSWELKNGRKPTKMILHHCDVRDCVNPDHLYEGTFEDNMRDAKVRNRFRVTTHCPRGHEYSVENTKRYNNGKHKVCLTCERQRDRDRYAKKKMQNQKTSCNDLQNSIKLAI